MMLTRWYHRWTQLSWGMLCASAVYLSSTRVLRNSCYANQPRDYIYIHDQGLFLGLCCFSFKSLNFSLLNCLYSCITAPDSQAVLFFSRWKTHVETWRLCCTTFWCHNFIIRNQTVLFVQVAKDLRASRWRAVLFVIYCCLSRVHIIP